LSTPNHLDVSLEVKEQKEAKIPFVPGVGKMQLHFGMNLQRSMCPQDGSSSPDVTTTSIFIGQLAVSLNYLNSEEGSEILESRNVGQLPIQRLYLEKY
jgi:hypothetical protein